MVNIPGGGTIRNTINWESFVDATETWYLHVIYGEPYQGNVLIKWHTSLALLNAKIGTWTNDIDVNIPIDATSGNYDAWTVLSTVNDPWAFDESNIIDERIDPWALVVTAPARIISTSFTQL